MGKSYSVWQSSACHVLYIRALVSRPMRVGKSSAYVKRAENRVRMRNVTAIDCVRASQEMAVTVPLRVLLAALLGLYWSSSRVACVWSVYVQEAYVNTPLVCIEQLIFYLVPIPSGKTGKILYAPKMICSCNLYCRVYTHTIYHV